MDYPDCPWDDARPSGRRPGIFIWLPDTKSIDDCHPERARRTKDPLLVDARAKVPQISNFFGTRGCERLALDQLIYSCPLNPRKETMIERLAILGTGLLGTSLGLALRSAGFKGSLVGWNRSGEGGREALAMGAVDVLASDPIAVARESQVVVLCVPIYSTLDFM